MFMVTVHKNSWKRALAVLGCAVILCGVVLGINGLVDGARATAAAASGNTVKSTEDMANFLLGYGVEVDVGTAQVLQVTIPKKFDDSFKAFNEVIQACGMDLSQYKGKMVEKWVLQSPNRTVENQTAYAVLLVKNAKVIGGYLLYQPSGEVISLRDTLDITTLTTQEEPAAETSAAGDSTQLAEAQSDAAQQTATDSTGETECVAEDTTQPAEQTAAEDPTGETAVTAPEETPAEETAAGAEEEQADIYPID